MTLLQAIILGIVQGLTEFLPISSSAHLVLVPFFLGWTSFPEEQVFLFDVLVQLGTLLAVIVYYWKDLTDIACSFVRGILQRKPFAEAESRMGWYIILATIPASLFGLVIKDQVEAAFNSPAVTALFLFLTAFLLLFSERIGSRIRSLDGFTWKDALWFGCAQALSIFPGVSRSGSTIAGGLVRNFDRPAAARFSFLMSIPVMIAAGLLTSLDMVALPDFTSFLPVVISGFITAAVVGYLSIRWLLAYLVRHSLNIFALYCLIIAAVTLIVFYV